MRYILAAILYLFSLSAAAELPKTLKVYTSGVGSTIPLCNKIFEEYDKIYNTNSILIIKPGVGGLTAMKEMLKDNQFSVLCYTGLTESVFNNFIYPGNEDSHKLLTMVSVIMESPTLFSTGKSHQYSTLPELIKSNKKIMVGHHNAFGKMIGELAFADNDKTFVNFKTATEALPSLIDGSLDVYIDSGGLTTFINSGKLKSLGHFNGISSTPGISLNKIYPNIAKLKAVGAITTSANNNKNDIEELNFRLSKIMQNTDIRSEFEKISAAAVSKSVNDSNEIIANTRIVYEKVRTK